MLDFLSKSSRLFGKLYKFSFETSCISMRCEYEPKRDTLITVGFSELKLYHLQNGLVFEMSRRYTIKKHADICNITRFFYKNTIIQTHLEKFNTACAALQCKIP